MTARNRPTGRNRRPLSEIAADIHKLQRSKLFAIGDLLIEAQEQCEHGEWLPWLEENDWSHTSAERYIDAERLRRKFPNLGNLKLARTTIYDLVDLDVRDDVSNDLMEDIITALAAKATDTQLRPDAASRIIELAQLRVEWGNFPEATLDALSAVEREPWREKSIEALKREKPRTDAAAAAVVLKVLREHVANLYYNRWRRTLPEFENERSSLEYLASVPEAKRAEVQAVLQAAEPPLKHDYVVAVIGRIVGGEDDTDDADDDDGGGEAQGSGDRGDADEQRESRRGGEPNGGANTGDPLDQVEHIIRTAIVGMNAEARLQFVADLNSKIRTVMEEVTRQEAETNRWDEADHYRNRRIN
jgi:hypothetical protein